MRDAPAVMSVLDWKMNMAFGSEAPSSVKVPVRANEPDAVL
jgi:hypothetical protein